MLRAQAELFFDPLLAFLDAPVAHGGIIGSPRGADEDLGGLGDGRNGRRQSQPARHHLECESEADENPERLIVLDREEEACEAVGSEADEERDGDDLQLAIVRRARAPKRGDESPTGQRE